MTAELIPFNRFNQTDLEAGLKVVAEAIKRDTEAAIPTQALIVCLGYADGATRLFSFGSRCSALETDGWLARALRRGGISTDGEVISGGRSDTPA